MNKKFPDELYLIVELSMHFKTPKTFEEAEEIRQKIIQSCKGSDKTIRQVLYNYFNHECFGWYDYGDKELYAEEQEIFITDCFVEVEYNYNEAESWHEVYVTYPDGTDILIAKDFNEELKVILEDYDLVNVEVKGDFEKGSPMEELPEYKEKHYIEME